MRVRRVATLVSEVVVARHLVAPSAEAHAARGIAVAPPRVLTLACAAPCGVASSPSAAAAGQARVRRIAARVGVVAVARRLVAPASDAHAARGLAVASLRMLTLACAALSAVCMCRAVERRQAMDVQTEAEAQRRRSRGRRAARCGARAACVRPRGPRVVRACVPARVCAGVRLHSAVGARSPQAAAAVESGRARRRPAGGRPQRRVCTRTRARGRPPSPRRCVAAPPPLLRRARSSTHDVSCVHGGRAWVRRGVSGRAEPRMRVTTCDRATARRVGGDQSQYSRFSILIAYALPGIR